MNVVIKEYTESNRGELESFRRQTIREGNDSLKSDKFNPEAIDGKIWCAYINSELASISVAEKSHYTDDPDIAVRICRYHILKKYRHSHCGFKMLPYQIEWAKQKNFTPQNYKLFFIPPNIFLILSKIILKNRNNVLKQKETNRHDS